MEKKSVAISVIFYILMIIIFAGILYFGATKLFFIEEATSKYKNSEYKTKIQNLIFFCDEVTNKGSYQNINVRSDILNSILFVENESYTELFEDFTFLKNETFFNETNTINKSVILVKFDFYNNSGQIEILDYLFVDYFNMQIYENDLVYNVERKPNVDLRIFCH